MRFTSARSLESYLRYSRSKNDLTKQLSELKNELLTLRVKKIAGGSGSQLTKMCVALDLFINVLYSHLIQQHRS